MPKSKETISDSDSASESGSNSEEEVKQKSKPKKVEKKKQESSASEDSESEKDTKSKKRAKKGKDDKGSNKKAKKESSPDEEDGFWDIGNNKKVNVRNFKGKWFVDIREMYMDRTDGTMKPGKKGICLNLDNWRQFMKVVEDVDKYVKANC